MEQYCYVIVSRLREKAELFRLCCEADPALAVRRRVKDGMNCKDNSPRLRRMRR